MTMFRITMIVLMILTAPTGFLWSSGNRETELSSPSAPSSADPGTAGAVVDTEIDTAAGTLMIRDATGREVEIPDNPEYIICSGPGALRLVSYLGAQDRVVAVDDMETRRPAYDARPYAMANPQFKKLPTFGEFRGHDNPELIVALDPQPQLIFKTYPSMGTDPVELQRKTGIPVLCLNYGNLFEGREDLYTSLRTIARILHRGARAEEIIEYIESTIDDLEERTGDLSEEDKPSCYVGGIAFKGPHGFQSTEPIYPPFFFLNARNVAYDSSAEYGELEHANVAKESIVMWNPEVLFVDVSTLQSDPQGSAIYELVHDPAYRGLSAVRTGEVYGMLPYNWYTQNFGSILANAYFAGSVLYPSRFDDMDPEQKADEIYRFLVGAAVFNDLNASFGNCAFRRIDLKQWIR
jgi:iron complex transport system substrate-binding protein